jgi:hypothetical protein
VLLVMKKVNTSTQPERPGGLLSGPQYCFRCVLNAPIILIVITGQAQKSVLVGALHLLGLAGEDYGAKGAVQMAQDNFHCGLKEDPPGRFGSAQIGNGFMAQDTRFTPSQTISCSTLSARELRSTHSVI